MKRNRSGLPFSLWICRKKVAICKPQSRSLPTTGCASVLFLNLSASRLWEKSAKPPVYGNFDTAAQLNQDTWGKFHVTWKECAFCSCCGGILGVNQPELIASVVQVFRTLKIFCLNVPSTSIRIILDIRKKYEQYSSHATHTQFSILH